MGYFCPENTFLQLKHNIQVIYLTLLPDFQLLCENSPNSLNVVLETISHFSRHNSSVFFWLKHYILSTKIPHESENFQTSTAGIKIYQIPQVIFQTESQFFF